MSKVQSGPPARFIPAGFFAFRTPLLPFDALKELTRVGALASGGEGWNRDALQHAREWLGRALEDPIIREALFLASPSLDESLAVWRSAPDSERGQKVERSLVRYFARMAGRATPFGLFASSAVGRFGTATRLRVEGRGALRKHTRLDAEYVSSLVDQLQQRPEVQQALRYFRNTSIQTTPQHYRYVEARRTGGKRSYGLVAVVRTPYLDAVLEQARGGATLDALARGLTSADSDISYEEARQYIGSLVDSQLLVSNLAPPLTGLEPVPRLLELTRDMAPLQPEREVLTRVQDMLGRMDALPPGLGPAAYQEVAQALEPLALPVELNRLFQVDTVRPGKDITLSQRVSDELLKGVEVMRRITLSTDTLAPLRQFRDRFAERYEERAVPLLEALDEERGIGFEMEAKPGATTGPLLQGFGFPVRANALARLDARWPHLLRMLDRAQRTGSNEIVLTSEDIEALEVDETIQLPDAFGVLGTLVARSAEDVDRGDFRFVFDVVQGPSGATLLGRFCQGNAELTSLVQKYLEAEEAHRPDAVFAEVVHMPDDRRMGNIAGRPALRRHDLVFLGQSGLPEDAQIDATDLMLSLERGRLVLRSKRLGREVVPRLTSAHNFSVFGLGVYRFLAMMQAQDGQGGSFSWGSLQHAPFLPRVVYRKLVLSPCRWNVERARLEEWGEAEGAARFEAVRRFREQMRIPRWVCLRDGDNLLPLDMDSPVCVDMLVNLVKGRPSASFEEVYPGPDELCVEGQDGRYAHSLIVPFVKEPAPRAQVAPAPAAPRPTAPPSTSVSRRFPPGSEWLYLKLYAGASTVDRLLRTELGDTVREVMASGAADRWFFLRFRDPQFHLRLRFHGAPARLDAEVWPRLRDTCARLLGENTGWRLQLDTYEREVERYGGAAHIERIEELFRVDSDAALELVRTYGGDSGADLRWRLLLKGMDTMLEDLGLSLEERLRVVQSLRTSFGTEFSVDHSNRFEEQLSQRMRHERKGLEALLSAQQASGGALQPGLAIFQRRGARIRPLAEELRLASQRGELTTSLLDVAGSLLHMQANRVLPDEHRRHELILYDFLTRLYRSSLARKRG